ncbi:MAG: hypothetical protein AB7K24_25455, partial [Gemmataceae bacterium]
PNMIRKMCTLAALLVSVSLVTAAEDYGLKKGDVDLKSAGALTFGPNGILFVADPQAASIYAIDTEDTGKPGGAIKVEKIDAQVAALLGTEAGQILINDIAVNPASGVAYLSVSRGKAATAPPAIVKVDGKGKPSLLNLKGVKFAKATLPNATGGGEAITDLALVKDRLFVAGLSNEKFASTLRAIPFPFAATDKGSSVEIYHGAHGKFETRSPVRTFAPFDIGGETHLLAAYTCTPLVKFPVSDLKPGSHVKGTTIAELGNRNKPLDMFVYEKDGKKYVLMANSSRGVMKITTEGIDKIKPITERVGGGGKAGLTYDTIDSLKGVQHLDRLDKGNALVLIRADNGNLNLETVPLP